jgi:hypothetical protein
VKRAVLTWKLERAASEANVLGRKILTRTFNRDVFPIRNVRICTPVAILNGLYLHLKHPR